VGEAEAVVTARMDKRWQRVWGTLGADEAPFSHGALVWFRARLIAHDLARQLVSYPGELAKASGKVGWQQVRAALDSSPLLGAGRVEDPWTFRGRAMEQLVGGASQVTGLPPEALRQKSGGTLLGQSRWKAALDGAWDDPKARQAGLQRRVEAAESRGRWGHQPRGAWPDMSRLMTQALEPDPSGRGKRLRRGTARDRLPALGDRALRHGRTSTAHPLTGYTRPVLPLLGSKLVVDAVCQPANQSAPAALETRWPALAAHGQGQSLSMDRAYLSSPLIGSLKTPGVEIIAQPWPLPKRGRFTKEQFQSTLNRHEVTCPAGVTRDLRDSGRRAQCPASTCGRCLLQAECTTATRGRTRSIPPQEGL
jgi:hypothetical protein